MVLYVGTEADQAMREQLEYLLAHRGECPDSCEECSRLNKVRELLLSPFLRARRAGA